MVEASEITHCAISRVQNIGKQIPNEHKFKKKHVVKRMHLMIPTNSPCLPLTRLDNIILATSLHTPNWNNPQLAITQLSSLPSHEINDSRIEYKRPFLSVQYVKCNVQPNPQTLSAHISNSIHPSQAHAPMHSDIGFPTRMRRARGPACVSVVHLYSIKYKHTHTSTPGSTPLRRMVSLMKRINGEYTNPSALAPLSHKVGERASVVKRCTRIFATPKEAFH